MGRWVALYAIQITSSSARKGPVFRVDPNAWNPLIVHITPQHLIVLKVMERERGQVMDLGAEIEKYFRGITNCVTCTLQERALHS